MNIFNMTKYFPKEEKYALIKQIRRASRFMCANLAILWAKNFHIKSFINIILGTHKKKTRYIDLKSNWQPLQVTNDKYEELVRAMKTF